MITKKRKNELKKMYKATQISKKIQHELSLFFVYLKGWSQSFPEESIKDNQLFTGLMYLIEQHDISFDSQKKVVNNCTVNYIKQRLTEQHFELTKILTTMSECGLDSLPLSDPDTWLISSVVNLHRNIEYVLVENGLEIISL